VPGYSVALAPHPALQFRDERRHPRLACDNTVRGWKPVDLPLDVEDGVDAAHRRDGERRFADIGQYEQLAAPMSPTRGFGDRTWPAGGMIEIVEPGIGVGLQDPRIAGEMLLGMNALRGFDRVSIDFATRRVRFVLPKSSAANGFQLASR